MSLPMRTVTYPEGGIMNKSISIIATIIVVSLVLSMLYLREVKEQTGVSFIR